MILWLLAIGLISVLGQVVLLRELNVAFYGSELIYVLALGVWLLWTATGAAVGRRTHVPAGRRVRTLLLATAWLLPLAVVLSRGLRILFGGVPGAYLPFPQQLAGMALVLLPVALMMGLLFQWAAKRYVGERRTLAAAYAIESVGALVGGVLATLFLRLSTSSSNAFILAALILPSILGIILRFILDWNSDSEIFPLVKSSHKLKAFLSSSVSILANSFVHLSLKLMLLFLHNTRKKPSQLRPSSSLFCGPDEPFQTFAC